MQQPSHNSTQSIWDIFNEYGGNVITLSFISHSLKIILILYNKLGQSKDYIKYKKKYSYLYISFILNDHKYIF